MPDREDAGNEMNVGLPSNVPLPPQLNLKGNIEANWRVWRQIWDSFEILSKLKTQPNEYRVATFITCVGTDALQIYRNSLLHRFLEMDFNEVV